MQALLGHASLSSTQIYIRAAGHHVREAAHAMPVRGVLRGIRQDTDTAREREGFGWKSMPQLFADPAAKPIGHSATRLK